MTVLADGVRHRPAHRGRPAGAAQPCLRIRPPARPRLASGPTAPLAAGARPRAYPVAGLSVPLFALSVGVSEYPYVILRRNPSIRTLDRRFCVRLAPVLRVICCLAHSRKRTREREGGLQIRTDPGGKHPRDMGDEEDKGGMDVGAIAAGGSTTVTKHGDVRIALSRMHASTNTHARTHAHTHSQHMHALTRAPTHAVRCPSTSCRRRSRSSTSTRARKR